MAIVQGDVCLETRIKIVCPRHGKVGDIKLCVGYLAFLVVLPKREPHASVVEITRKAEVICGDKSGTDKIVKVVASPVDPGCRRPDTGSGIDRAVPLNHVETRIDLRPPGPGASSGIVVIRIENAAGQCIDAMISRTIVLLLFWDGDKS